MSGPGGGGGGGSGGEGRTLRRLAHAKINLCLSVGPPPPPDPASTPPGMHPISSWMAAVELADEVEVTALGRDEASRYRVEWAPDAPRKSPIDWALEKDLAVRAHRLLEARCGRALPVDMVVRKRTPVGGGLGGGSSDGAAALMGINELFGLGLSTGELVGLSATLGSDVAFFIDDAGRHSPAPARPAIVAGFGHLIERAEFVSARVLLVLPAFGTPTGPVYRAYDAAPPHHRALRDAQVRGLAAGARSGGIDSANLFNDLEAPACVVEPRLGELLGRLRTAGVGVHMSGSGSTLFVLDPTREQIDAVGRVAPEAVLVETRLAGAAG